MGNSDDDFRSDGRTSPSCRKNHRRNGRRRSNPTVECAPLRRSSNSGLPDFRQLRRPSAPCVPGGGMKPPIPPTGRDRKRSGPLSRPMSKERIYSDGQSPPPTLEEDDHFQDSEMLTASITECSMSIGSPYSMTFSRQDSGSSGLSNRSYSPGENNSNSRLTGMTERRRNKTNLQMNQRAKGQGQGQGRIQYDRSFLLQLQFEPESLQRPTSLPLLPEIILDAPKLDNSVPRRSFNDFTPNYARSNQMFANRVPGVGHAIPRTPIIGSGPPPGMGGDRRSAPRRSIHSKEQQAQPPRKVIQVSLQHNVQLHTSENAWKPVYKKESLDDDRSNEELYRKVRGILNKLTPQKFQTLIQQVRDLKINTEEKLKGSIDLIFEKAISEPNFSVAYANLARCLVNLKVSTDDSPDQTVTFRKLLLNRCQREFEKDKLEEIDLEKMQALIDSAETEEKKKHLKEEKEKAEAKSKKRSLGNIRFIGELYKLKMLTEGIMHDCIMRLLRYSHDEDNLECLSRLLTTIGQDIDHDKSRPRVDQYVNQLRKIIDSRKISSRIKFMLQDLLELRENGWVPRHEDNKPKMIEQIHKEAEQEEQQKQVLLQRASQEQRNFRRPRTPGLISGSVSEEGWRSASNMVDPNRMKLTKHQVEDIQLGPGGRPGYSTWQRGSSGGGSRTPSLEREKPPRHGSNDNYDYRNHARTMPRGKGLAMRSMEKDRNAAIAAVRSIAAGNLGESRHTPTSSRNASRDSSCSRELTRESQYPGETPRSLGDARSMRNCEMSRGSAELGGGASNLSRGSGEVERGPRNAMPGSNNSSYSTGETRATPERETSTKEVEKKVKSILEEYLHICDLEEASTCVGEFHSSKIVTTFVTEAVNCALERSADERKNLGRLLAYLVKKKHATLDNLVAGFRYVLTYAEDMEIDIPKIWQYLGQLVAVVVSDGWVPLRLLKSFCEPISDPDKKSLLLAAVLQILAETLGRDKVQVMWRESRLSLEDFVPDRRLNEYVKSHNLAWIQSNCIESSASFLSNELDRRASNSATSNEEIISWIKANVSPDTIVQASFIRDLTTAVCKMSVKAFGDEFRVEKEQLKNRSVLLSKFFGPNVSLQVQGLYALQHFVHNLQHPQGVLRNFFDILYDEDVVSEEAFNRWYNSDDETSDQLGKGVAKTSVVQFFSWLHEADEQ